MIARLKPTSHDRAEYVHDKQRLIVRPRQEICYSYVCAWFVVRVFGNKKLSFPSSLAAPVSPRCTPEVPISVSGYGSTQQAYVAFEAK